MRIYLAARYSRREELQGYRAELEQRGHEVTSRWVWTDHDLPLDADPGLGGLGVRFAMEDWEDLLRSDCVISFTEDPTQRVPGRARGGRHVEFGIALAVRALRFKGCLHHGRECALRPPVPFRPIVVGARENVFHHLPEIEFFATWPEALASLPTPWKGGPGGLRREDRR